MTIIFTREEENDFIEKVKINDVIGVRNILKMFESQKQKQKLVDDDEVNQQEQKQQQTKQEESFGTEQQQQKRQREPFKQQSEHIHSVVNCYDIKDGMTPLMFAIKSIEMIEILLEYGANINAQDNEGKTVLHYACYGGNYYDYNIITMLLQNHANPNIQNNIGETSLHIACSRWDSKMISILIQQYHANVNIQTITDGNTPLHYMTQNYHYHDDIENGIKLLFENRADPNIQNQFGETPLYNAIENFGNYRTCCIILLLKYKSNINIQRTRMNPNINNQCQNQLFPDHLFPNDEKYHHHNHNSIVGDTALHCAIRNSDVHVVQLLLANYPNTHIINSHNETVYDLAQKMNDNKNVNCSKNNNDNNIVQYIETYIKHVRTISYQYLYNIWMNQK